MEPSLQPESLWNALVLGGEPAAKAIVEFNALPELKREIALTQLLRRAEEFISTLIEKESEGRHVFRPLKDGLLRVLESVPTLANSSPSRQIAIAHIHEIDRKSIPLTNMDILMKCDEVLKELKRPDTESLAMPEVINCKSIEELKEHLGNEIPPELIEEINKEGGAFIVQVVIKKPKK